MCTSALIDFSVSIEDRIIGAVIKFAYNQNGNCGSAVPENSTTDLAIVGLNPPAPHQMLVPTNALEFDQNQRARHDFECRKSNSKMHFEIGCVNKT